MTAYTDLVARAQAGDSAAFDTLIAEFRPVAYGIARDHYLRSADHDDVRQEALYGLVRAVHYYRPDRGMGFPGFARLCVERWLATIVRHENRYSHRMLTDTIRVLRDAWGEEFPASELIEDPRGDVPSLVEARERIIQLQARIQTLTPAERRALIGQANGLTYEQLGPVKAVDNAIQRARRKLAA